MAIPYSPSGRSIGEYIPRRARKLRTVLLSLRHLDKSSGQVAGGARSLQIDTSNRRSEIGSIRLGKACRRTAINTEAKLLMHSHAFEMMGCVRVEFLADAENERSRTALRRIGAFEDGRAVELPGRGGRARGRPGGLFVCSNPSGQRSWFASTGYWSASRLNPRAGRRSAGMARHGKTGASARALPGERTKMGGRAQWLAFPDFSSAGMMPARRMPCKQ